jgi:hypothetical protein
MPFLHLNDMDMLNSEVVPRNLILMSLSPVINTDT